MASELGFGIVGAGMVARYHATAIERTPGARLVAVCRPNRARAEETAARFGVPCLADYPALLARDDVEAVCICTPSGMHAEQTIAAARAGKHVLVEKPMALTLADADAMIDACAQAGVLLGVALQRRTEPDFQRLRAAIAAGELGRLVLGSVSVPYMRAQSYYDSAAWRGTWALDGGGALMNQGIHLIDLLLWLMGDATEARASAATLAHDIEVEDCITAALRFGNGALGSVMATTAAAPGFPHRVEIYGDRGGVQIEGEQIVRWEGENHVQAPGASTESREPIAAGAGSSPTGIGAVGHTRLLADFAAAIRERRDPLVPGAEGRRALALVLAIYESARTGSVMQVG
ncbi:MAG TPA: Gfo/Idh/MocA family oxidoreductase [Roseiflexaceae bacterium]|nr:Gfo/Idh/MocA family oxidoreductase [Roseiflexaceae bacterium]